MALRNFINGLDFWDKEENAKQRAAAVAPQKPAPQPAQLPKQGQPGFHVLKPGNQMLPQPKPVAAIKPAQPKIGGNGIGSKVGNALLNNPVTNALDRAGENVFGSKPAMFAEQMVGNTAQSLVRGGMALNQNIGNAEVVIAHKLGLAKDVKTQTGQQFVDQSIGNNLNKAVGYTGTARQQALDAVNNASWLIPGAGKGVNALAAKTGQQVAAKTAPIITTRLAAGAGKGVEALTRIGGHAQVGGVTAGIQGGISQAIADPDASIGSIAQATADNYKMGLAFGGAGSAAATVAPHVVPAVQAADRQIRVAQNTMNGYNGLIGDIQRSDRQIATLKQLQATNPDPIAFENYQRKSDIEVANGQVLRQQAAANRPNVTTRLVGAQLGNTVGGPNALGYMYAKKHGRVFDGVDGKPRFEIDDSRAKIANPNGATLGEVLDHPELYKNYPDLANTPVLPENNPTLKGSFDGNTIRVNRLFSDSSKKGTILHELQHAVQKKEKFSEGGDAPDLSNPFSKASQDYRDYVNTSEGKEHFRKLVLKEVSDDPTLTDTQAMNLAMHKMKDEYGTSQYRKLAGEAEARAVESRANLKDSERYIRSEPSYKQQAKEGIHKQPNLSNKQLDSLSPEAIAGLKQQGYKGVSNGKRTVMFDEPKQVKISQYTEDGKDGEFWTTPEGADIGYGSTKKDAYLDLNSPQLFKGSSSYDYVKNKGLLTD